MAAAESLVKKGKGSNMSTVNESSDSHANRTRVKDETTVSTTSTWMQLAAVVAYILSDTVLRFLYHDVIAGRSAETTDDSSEEDSLILSYDKPMFLSYCAYVCFAFWGFLVVPYVWFIRRTTLKNYMMHEWLGAMHYTTALQWCSVVVFLMNFQNFFYLSGLRYVRVAVSTAVGQCEAPFTVCFAVFSLGRRFVHQEFRGVILCLTGIGLIVIPPLFKESSDDESSADSLEVLLGVVSTMIGALLFSLYQIFWQKFDKERFPSATISPAPQKDGVVYEKNPTFVRPNGVLESIIDSITTISVSGICNLVVGLLLLIVMHIMGAETLEMPPMGLWGEIIPTCFLSAFVDAMAGIACVIASALVVAMSYPLTIPLSVILEVSWGGIPISEFGWTGWIGTVSVLAGIFFLESEQEDLICVDDEVLSCGVESCYALSTDDDLFASERPVGEVEMADDNVVDK